MFVRIASLFFVLVVTLSLAACSDSGPTNCEETVGGMDADGLTADGSTGDIIAQ